MRKIKWIAGIFMISILSAGLFIGCATTGSDMAYSNRGFEELCKQNYTKAEEYLEKALEINPNNPYAILNMGCVCQNTGRPEKARQMYQKVIDLESQAPAERSNEDWARGKKLSEIAKKNLETFKIECRNGKNMGTLRAMGLSDQLFLAFGGYAVRYALCAMLFSN